MSTANVYAEFAALEARGVSAAYERLAAAVAVDARILALLDGVPVAKRQPNLLFAVVRLLGGPVGDPAAFRDFTVANWASVEPELLSRSTQTNEPGRCAVLLPVLAALPQPVALLEVGASAGLGLYPDRYTYRYGDHQAGAGGPVLECSLTGRRPPDRLPEVVWRAGLDLNPLRVTDPADIAWLDALIWPEHHHRRDRLRAAAAIAAADPPELVRGDLVDDLPALAARAPADATLVVFHTSVLYQVPAGRRAAFADLVRTLPGHRISVESPDVVPFKNLPPAPDATLHNVLALDDVPLAWARGHGQAVAWFGWALESEAAAFTAALENLSPPDWELPTRCTPWLVRDVVGHVITVLSRVPDMVAAPAPPAPDTTATSYYRDDERFNDTANTLRVRTAHARAESRDGGSLAGEFAATVETVLAVSGQDRLVRTRHGDAMLLTDFLTTRVVELAVHGLDVADAVGRPAWLTSAAAEHLQELLFGPDWRTAVTELGWDPVTVLRRATGRATTTAADTERLIEIGLRPLTLG